MSDSFAGAEAEALQFLQGGSEKPEGQPTEVPSSGASTDTPTPVAPQGGSTAHVQLADDALVEVTVNGQKVVKPWKQARSEMMLHEDYTRKRQAEAAEVKQAREFADSVRTRDAAYKELVGKPENIIKLYEAVTGQKLTPAEKQEVRQSNDEVATLEDIQKAREDLKRETGEVVASAIQELQDSTFIADIQRVSSTTINAILDEKKDIKAFYGDDAADILKAMARKSQPSDGAELKAALIAASDVLAKRVEEQLQERLKKSAVKQTELKRKGIEPPGGTGIPAQPKTYTSGKNVNWGDIDKDAEAFMQGRLNS